MSVISKPVLALVIGGLALGACGTGKPTKSAGIPGLGDLPTPASAWSQASSDARRDSATKATGPTTAAIKWKRDLGASVIAGPVIGADGSIIVTPSNGIVHALDPATGRDRWTLAISQAGGSDLSSSPAVLAGGLILVPGARGDLVAISERGTKLWSQHIGGGQVLSPAIAGAGRVDVIDMDGTVLALKPDASGAHPQWRLALKGMSFGSPAVAPDGDILTTTGKSLVAIRDNDSSGNVAWTFAAKADVEVSPAVTAAGIAILGTNGDAEYGVKSDGTLAWSYPKKQWSYSSPVATTSGIVAFGDNDGRVYEVKGGTGVGSIPVPPGAAGSAKDSKGVGVWTAPVVDAAGHLYVGTASGHLEGFTAAGMRLFDLDTGSTVDSYPALGADGTLYAGSNNGTLYALGD